MTLLISSFTSNTLLVRIVLVGTKRRLAKYLRVRFMRDPWIMLLVGFVGLDNHVISLWDDEKTPEHESHDGRLK